MAANAAAGLLLGVVSLPLAIVLPRASGVPLAPRRAARCSRTSSRGRRRAYASVAWTWTRFTDVVRRPLGARPDARAARERRGRDRPDRASSSRRSPRRRSSQRHVSPGSNATSTIGCSSEAACFDACRFGDESQQPTCAARQASRRCDPPAAGRSSPHSPRRRARMHVADLITVVHADRSDGAGWGRDRTRLQDQNLGLPLRPPRRAALSVCARAYDPAHASPHRRDPGRRPGHPDELGDAEGPARPVRLAARALAGRGREGGRGRARRRRRRAGPGARGPPARRRRARRAGGAARDRRRGAGGGRRTSATTTPCVVLVGDVPLITAEAIAALADAHDERGAAGDDGTMVLDDPGAYGRVVRDADGRRRQRVVETKAAGRRDARGARDPRGQHRRLRVRRRRRCVDALAPRRRPTTPRASTTCPTSLPILRGDGARSPRTSSTTRRSRSASTTASTSRDVRELAQRRILERHMRNGVTIVDPAATTIDVDGRRSAATRSIEPCTRPARRDARRRRAARIGPRTTLVDATLGDGVDVAARLPRRLDRRGRRDDRPVRVPARRHGPARGRKVGTFVEMKNSDIGEGTKVPAPVLPRRRRRRPGHEHRARRTSPRTTTAATSTATTIGADVKTGVDTTFVAPVTVGDGAVIAAGSVITEDVPPERARRSRAPGRRTSRATPARKG